MVPITALWLPILLSAVAVFIASSIINMLLPYHRSDYKPLSNEAEVMDRLRAGGVTPGDYVFPWASSMKEMSSDAYVARRTQGPVGFLTIGEPGPVSMGKNLALWFLFALVVSHFAAYVCSLTFPPGAPYLTVFRVVTTVAFAGYALGLWEYAIWYSRSWRTTAKFTFDGLIYALLTAGIFGWLWPS